MNPMREIRIEKVTLNIGCGDDKTRMEHAKKLLETITARKIIITKTKRRTTFGMAKGRPVGVKVTLRGESAIEMFKKVLEAVDKTVKLKQFDDSGNLSIGIKEYIDMPDVKYDPDIGIIGMDVAVTLERPGYSIKRRSKKGLKVGKKHLITKEEAVEWIKKNFGVNVSD